MPRGAPQQSSPKADCSAALRPGGDCAAFRGGRRATGRRASRQIFDEQRYVEQRAVSALLSFGTDARRGGRLPDNGARRGHLHSAAASRVHVVPVTVELDAPHVRRKDGAPAWPRGLAIRGTRAQRHCESHRRQRDLHNLSLDQSLGPDQRTDYRWHHDAGRRPSPT